MLRTGWFGRSMLSHQMRAMPVVRWAQGNSLQPSRSVSRSTCPCTSARQRLRAALRWLCLAFSALVHCSLQRQPARGGTTRPRGLVDLAEAAWRRCKIDKRIRKGRVEIGAIAVRSAPDLFGPSCPLTTIQAFGGPICSCLNWADKKCFQPWARWDRIT